MDVRRTRAKPLSPEDRRAAIIAATRPLLIEHGERVTTRLIAEAAGIAEGTIFRVFADKRELYHAVAEETVNPPGARERMEAELVGLPDLEAKLRHTIDRLAERTRQTVPVMIAVRHALAHEPHGEQHGDQHGDQHGKQRKGPPRFIIEANEALLTNLTELLFEPHADELRLPPGKAALVLRGLTIGAWLPGLARPEQPLSADDVIDTLLNGILRKDAT